MSGHGRHIPRDPSGRFGLYADTKYSFSLRLPPEWVVVLRWKRQGVLTMEFAGDDRAAKIGGPYEQLAPRVHVRVHRLPRNTDGGSYVEDALGHPSEYEMKLDPVDVRPGKGWELLRLLPLRAETVNGRPATVERTAVRLWVYEHHVLTAGCFLYKLDTMALIRDWAWAEPLLDEIVQSFTPEPQA